MSKSKNKDTVVAVCPKCKGMKKNDEEVCFVCDGQGVVFKREGKKAGDNFQKYEYSS